MRYRRLSLLSMVMVYAAIVGSVLYQTRPVEASTRPASEEQAAAHRFVIMRSAIDQSKTPQPNVDLPEGKGKELAKKQCGTCHANNVWTNQHHTRDQWSSVIDNMISKGMHVSDEDLDTITDYLAANFGPVPASPPPSAVPATPPPSR